MESIHSKVLKKSILIRETEETLLDLFSKGRLNGTVHTCIGQEYVGALLPEILIKGDVVFSNHRCHGHYIGRTDDVEGLLLEVMGSSLGAVSGVGGSQHLYHENGFYSNGILAGMTPVASGYAHTLINTKNIVCFFVGDGATGEGVFYESLNLISKFNLPIVIINENNNYSQSTSKNQTFFGDMKTRVEGFGLNYKKVNIWDLENLIEELTATFNDIRLNKKPIYIEVECYRLKAHSKGDDNRDTKEINKYLAIDPINIFNNNNNELYLKYKNEATQRINLFLDKHPDVSNDPELSLMSSSNENKIIWIALESYSNKRVNDLIYESIKENMEINEDIFFIGEDIEFPYGGAFKVSKDLSDRFKDRVYNMPDSEQAIVGFGNGMSLGGKLPICEIMFGDFLGLIFDQWLNHAAKFQKMYGNKFNIPIIIRTPMGGKRGYGPTHSQNIEKHFLGIPNTQVIAINPRQAPKEIYNVILQTIDKPTLIIENKLDYTRKDTPKKSISNYKYYKNNFPIYDLKYSIIDDDPDITVVCWGGLVCELEEIINDLTEREEIIVEMIIPTMLYPLNINSIVDSVLKTKKMLIIEDDSSFGTLGSEIIALLSRSNYEFLSIQLNTSDDIIPSSKLLEEKHYVSKQEIYDEMKRLFLL
jgi:2-oxoisovalerate dehydrogenase E1 component